MTSSAPGCRSDGPSPSPQVANQSPRPTLHSCPTCKRIVVDLEKGRQKHSETTVVVFRDVSELVAAYQQCPLIQRSLASPTPTSSRRIQTVAELSDCVQKSKFDSVASTMKPTHRISPMSRLKSDRHALCELRIRLKVEEMSFNRRFEPRQHPYTQEEADEMRMWNLYELSWHWVFKGSSSIVASFAVYAEREDVAARWVASRPITQHPDSRWSFHLANLWLKECRSTHELCRTFSVALPKYLINVGGDESKTKPFLFETRSKDNLEYATLSYCWGEGDSHGTMRANNKMIQIFKTQIPEEKLPKTIQDAFKVCRKIGLHYLWVDSLCINQDDEDEKAKEIGRMNRIYSGSVVTICAASAKTCQAGFLDSRQQYSGLCGEGVKATVICPNGVGHIVLQQKENPDTVFNVKEPIHARGWTLQEHILSTRILFYGTHQLRWICRTGQHVDGGHHSSATDDVLHSFRSFSGNTVLLDWQKIVKDYTRRELRYPQDKLLALAGIAEAYNKHLDGKYLAGLWDVGLPQLLFWYLSGESRHPQPVYRAPSWSWAAVEGPVNFLHWEVEYDDLPGHARTRVKRMNVIDFTVQVANIHTLYGAVKNGSLTCRGLMQSGQLNRFENTTSFELRCSKSTLVATMHFDSWNWSGKIPKELNHLQLLIVERSLRSCFRGLILTPVDFAKATFRREGIWSAFSSSSEIGIANESWINNCEERTITIL